MLLFLSAIEKRYAPVAQLDRVTDYESVGRGFESLPAYQKQETPSGVSCFCFPEETRRCKSNLPGQVGQFRLDGIASLKLANGVFVISVNCGSL